MTMASLLDKLFLFCIITIHTFTSTDSFIVSSPWSWSYSCSYSCGQRSWERRQTLSSKLTHEYTRTHRSSLPIPCLSASSNQGNDNNNNKDNDNNNNNDTNDNDTRSNDKDDKENDDSNNPKISEAELQLQREVKKYRARAEIDALLNDPDAPFDVETELQKVTGGISPPLPTDSDEAKTEEEIHTLETSMYEAASNRDFDKAHSSKIELNQRHIDDCGYVLEANSVFYKAFSNKDYDKMEDVWLHDSSALCIHPSHKPIMGAKNVLASWKSMFQSGNDGFQRNKMEPTNIRLSVKGTTAIITCDEEVYTRRFVRGRKRLEDNSGMELVNRLIATNIFRKVGGRWFMVHHHSTWHADSEAAKKALSSQMGNSITKEKSDSDMNISSVEKLLGIPGHEGLGGEKKKLGDKKGPPVKRIFTGSLSDLFGGGLNDILKEDDDEDDDDEDDDEDDDDDDGIIIANMVVNGQQGNSISNRRNGNGNIITLNDQGEQISDALGKDIVKKEKNESSKDISRQNCIVALRKLSTRGVISPNQKRMLLTDIITSAARGEYSLVEVAYDLICGEGDDSDAAEEDFAEQCKVFAGNLERDVRIQ